MTRWSTRLLLTIAAIAVAGGLIGIPNAFLFNALSFTQPWALGLAAGLYLLPGILAQAVLRRGGVGLLAELLAGLVAMPFSPTGPAAMIAYLILGLLIEAPFLVLRYRYWKPRMFVISAVWVAAVYGLFWGLAYDTPSLGLFVAVVQPVLLCASVLVVTAIALLVARLLDRTGVLRGIRAPEDRRARTDAAAPSP